MHLGVHVFFFQISETQFASKERKTHFNSPMLQFRSGSRPRDYPKLHLNHTTPQRGSWFGMSAWTRPSSGSGFGIFCLQTRPHQTLASLCLPSCIHLMHHEHRWHGSVTNLLSVHLMRIVDTYLSSTIYHEHDVVMVVTTCPSIIWESSLQTLALLLCSLFEALEHCWNQALC